MSLEGAGDPRARQRRLRLETLEAQRLLRQYLGRAGAIDGQSPQRVDPRVLIGAQAVLANPQVSARVKQALARALASRDPKRIVTTAAVANFLVSTAREVVAVPGPYRGGAEIREGEQAAVLELPNLDPGLSGRTLGRVHTRGVAGRSAEAPPQFELPSTALAPSRRGSRQAPAL